MGRRQSQRKSAHPQPVPGPENSSEKRPQRRKQKSKTSASRCTTHRHRAQGTSGFHPTPSAEECIETKVLLAAPHCGYRENKHTGVFCSRSLSDYSTELLQSLNTQEDSESDSEKCFDASPYRVAPQLDLRPEVMEDENSLSDRVSGRGHGDSDFPDFLPPPFNSWNLSQLAVFYNTDGMAAPRPRPRGPLERFLERLLQLEWRQIQTVQEELGKPDVSEVISSCHRSATSSCLSSPKCILQCQRAFPLTFLTSVASYSTVLSGCACTPCRIRYSTCSTLTCRSVHIHSRQLRLSPMCSQEPSFLPKRSYSESRAFRSDSMHRALRCSSPVRTSSHLIRMEASGNIRNPTQSSAGRLHHTYRDSSEHRERGVLLDCTRGAFRRRSGSEQRKHGAEGRWSSSEWRQGRAEQRRTDMFTNKTKPGPVTAVRKSLPEVTCSTVSRPSRTKAVQFLT